MLKLLVSSLAFFLFPCLSAAQFAAYPVCVQPILTQAFPAKCLSSSLVAQNTCLCQNANAFGSAFVTTINQQCGCAALQETVQLTDAYCTQVGVDVGPAFSVFVQDNTPCGGSPSSSASPSTGTGTSTVIGSSTNTESVVSTSTSTGGSTSESSGSASNTGTEPTKNSGANNRVVIEQVLNIVVGVTGAILAL